MVACNRGTKQTAVVTTEETASQTYFPVTDYLQGQIQELKQSGINPVKISKTGNKVDSAWLKMEQLDSAFGIFLSPVIDTTNLKEFFTESKFHDKTINSYTFTYEPKVALPDSLMLRRWDVYVDPKSGNVKRIFMEKETSDKKTIKMSWTAGSGALVTWFNQDKQGNWILEKEEQYIWNFEEEQ